jgi:hypothetical protein
MHQIFRFDFATVLHDGAVFFSFDMVMFNNGIIIGYCSSGNGNILVFEAL